MFRIVLLVGLALGVPLVSGFPLAAMDGAAHPADAPIKELIDALDDPRFATRTRATRALEQLGGEALPYVARRAATGSREATARALALLKGWSRSGQQPLESASVAALEALARDSSGEAAAAKAILAWRRETIATEVLAFFEDQDAKVSVRHLPGRRSFAIQLTDRWKGREEDLDRLRDLEGLSWLSMQNAAVTNRAMEAIAPCTALEYLFLGDTAIDARGLAALRDLENLKYLSLENLRVGDEIWPLLAPLQQLESLGLDGTRVTDQGLSGLAQFPKLKKLWLDETEITDAGLVHLKGVPQLENLYLSKTQAGGAGLAHLADLPNLTYLSLKEVQLDAEAASHLAQLTKLNTLGLDHTNATDETVAHLAHHPQLQVLWLSRTEVTDACLEHLKLMPVLRTVYLNGSKVSKEGAEKIQQELRNCKVQY